MTTSVISIEKKVCKCCKDEKPISRFVEVERFYTKNNGEQRVYRYRLGTCNDCRIQRMKPAQKRISKKAFNRGDAFVFSSNVHAWY